MCYFKYQIRWLIIALGFLNTVCLAIAGDNGRSWICIPAGVIGDAYWVYMNDKIVSAPPHTGGDPKIKNHCNIFQRRDGFELFMKKNEFFDGGLSMLQEHYNDNNLSGYLGSGLEEEQHLFNKISLPDAPDKYTVEVVMLKDSLYKGNSIDGPTSSFPFVVTRKYVVDNSPDNIPRDVYNNQHYVAIPKLWRGKPNQPQIVHAVFGSEPRSPSPPDAARLSLWVNNFLDDPLVKMLQDIQIDQISQPNWLKILDLPESQGGSREFDRKQIGLIAEEILQRHYFPEHSEVEMYMKKYPEYSEAFSNYNKILSAVDEKMKLFKQLAKYAE